MKKQCTKCKDEKELNEFYKNDKGKLGRMSWCKSCWREINKGYKKNPEEHWLKMVIG